MLDREGLCSYVLASATSLLISSFQIIPLNRARSLRWKVLTMGFRYLTAAQLILIRAMQLEQGVGA